MDFGRSQSVTFGELQDAVDRRPTLTRGSMLTVNASSGILEFVIQTLRAWRDEAVLCPAERGAPPPSLTQGLPEGVAHVKTTSGSTGTPRLVLFEAGQLIADFENIRATMDLDRTMPNLGVVSPAHSYGFSNLILPLLLDGMPLWMLADPLPGSMRSAWNSVTGRFTVAAVPALWRAWQQAGALHRAPIGLAISAGAPLPLELEGEVHAQHHLKIHNFYGSSECGGIAYDSTLEPRTNASQSGQPMRGAQLWITEEGCLAVAGKAVGRGYWPADQDAIDSARLRGGIFITTDLAELRCDGLHLLGRQSDTINVAGRKVAPADVEAALLSIPEVECCVVFGFPSRDSSRVEDVVACVRTTKEIDRETLLMSVSSKLEPWQRPRRWWFNPALGPDARGKFPRAVWRQRFAEHETPAPISE